MEEERRPHGGKCMSCGSPLELYEIDLQKATRILQCQQCGLFHFYKKGFFGGWKLLKATKGFDQFRKSSEKDKNKNDSYLNQ